jgi:hypothetical protein
MTKKKIDYAFQEHKDNPTAARQAWKEQRDELRKQVKAAQRKTDKALAGRRPLDERAAREELEALQWRLTELDEAWRQHSNAIALGEFAQRDEIISGFEDDIRFCDQEILGHLLQAYKIALDRVGMSREYKATRDRLYQTATRNGLEAPSPLRSEVVSVWGHAYPASNGDQKIAADLLGDYAGRLSQMIGNANVVPENLNEFISKGVL